MSIDVQHETAGIDTSDLEAILRAVAEPAALPAEPVLPAARSAVDDVDLVAPGVDPADLARIAALAGFGPRPVEQEHPAVVAARLESSAATIRAMACLLSLLAVGLVAFLLVP